MLNVTKIKKLITKNVRINGASFPPTEDRPGTDILFTIEGVVAFKISSYDTEIVAKLIEVGAMEPNYTFKNTSDLSSLFNNKDTVPFDITPVVLRDDKKELCIVKNANYVSVQDKSFLDCFKDGTFVGQGQKYGTILYHIDNDRVMGIIMPVRVKNLEVFTEIADKITPTVTIKEGDDHFGYCSNCQRAEKIRTWHDYKYCPCCGHKIERR